MLAGGAGTRLRGVVTGTPKPLVPVCGRPFLEWLLLSLRRQGVTRVILSTGYLADVVEAHFGATFAGIALEYSRETIPLGTGGAARAAFQLARGRRVFLLNGDSYCHFDLGRLEQAFDATGARAAMWLVDRAPSVGSGAVMTDRDGRVTSFVEKVDGATGYTNAGVYLIEGEALSGFRSEPPLSMERDVLPKFVEEGLYAILGDDFLVDIGTPASLAAAGTVLRDEFAALEADLTRGEAVQAR